MQAAELVGEGFPHPAPVLIIEVEHSAPLEAQPVSDPAREGCSMGEIAGAEPERVGTQAAHVRR